MNVAVFDVLGKQVVKTMIKQKLDISMLKSGIYFVQINQGSITITKKLVVR
jgi:hypothetical protein